LRISEEVALLVRQLKPFEAVNGGLHHCATKQFSPAALSIWQACFASAGDEAPARSRIPPENGTIILFIAAIVGKRADSAAQARSACAWLAKAPIWITLPEGPLGFGSGATGTLVSLGGMRFGSGAGAGFGGVTGCSATALRLSLASLSSPALVSNAVWLSPATSSPPGFGGFTLYGPGSARISSGCPAATTS